MVKALYHNTASESAVNSETLPIMVGHFWFAFGLSCADDQELWNTLFNSDYFKLLRQTLTQEEKEYVSIFINDFFRVFYLSNFDIEFKKQAKILNSSISESALKDEVAQELGLMEKRYEWSDQLYFKEDITSEEFAELDTLFRQRLMLKRLEIIQESCPLFVELQQINQRLDKNRVIAELQAYAEKQASSLVYTQENLRKARFTVESFFSEFIKELKK
jgi:hypothetical protein